MALLAQLTNKAFAVGPITPIPFSLTGSPSSLVVGFTRSGMPSSGDVFSATVTWSDGSAASETIPGGVQLNKDGSTRTVSEVNVSVPPGVTQGTVTGNVMQAFTTTVTVNSVP